MYVCRSLVVIGRGETAATPFLSEGAESIDAGAFFMKPNTSSWILTELYMGKEVDLVQVNTRYGKVIIRPRLLGIILHSDLSILTPLPFVWRRRSDLSGTKFRAVSRDWPPFVTGFDASTGRPKGVYADLFRILEARLNFSLDVHYMRRNEDPMTWTQMMDAIVDGRFKIGLTGFSLVLDRFEKVHKRILF